MTQTDDTLRPTSVAMQSASSSACSAGDAATNAIPSARVPLFPVSKPADVARR